MSVLRKHLSFSLCTIISNKRISTIYLHPDFSPKVSLETRFCLPRQYYIGYLVGFWFQFAHFSRQPFCFLTLVMCHFLDLEIFNFSNFYSSSLFCTRLFFKFNLFNIIYIWLDFWPFSRWLWHLDTVVILQAVLERRFESFQFLSTQIGTRSHN